MPLLPFWKKTMGVEFPDDSETLSGLVFSLYGAVPEDGSTFTVEYEGIEILVNEVLEHQVIGVIREVSEGAILVESKDSVQAVNLDFILRIREYPKKPNGKKKGIIVD